MARRHTVLARISTVALATAMFPALAAAQSQETAPTPSGSDVPAKSTPAELQALQHGPLTSINADGSTSADNPDGDVVVTGSRIRLPNLGSLEPTVTLGREYLEQRGLTNVADALNEQPIFRNSVTPQAAQGSFNQAVNYLNVFGLGSNRTLTLVNGRRFVTSNAPTQFTNAPSGSQVDLNVINELLTDRVDTVDIGGAPVYGSDAIAGTVNIILRDRVKNLTVQATSGITDRGDGFHYSVSALGGHDFLDGKFNITAAYQHDQQDGVLYNDRDFLRANIAGATNPTNAQAAALGRNATGITAATDGRLNTSFGYNNSATDGNPGTINIANERIYYLTQGGLITGATGNAAVPYSYQFNSAGQLVPFNKGIIFPSIYASGGDGYALNDFSQITSQIRRDIGNLFLHYDHSDALKFFFEGEYYNSRGNQLVRQPTYNSNLFAGTSGPLTFSATSPFLTPQAQAQLAALGVTKFSLSRGSVDLADLSGYTQTDLFRGVLGARGDFKVGSRPFNYEVYANIGQTRIHDHSQDLNAQNFVNAVNVTTNAAGQIVCNPNVSAANSASPGNAPVADAACVPLNLIGYGQPSAAARAYVIAQNVTQSVLKEYDFNANVGGSPMDLFGNKTAFNVGYEHRQEEGSFTPSAFQQAGLGRSTAIPPTSGKYRTDEIAGEIQLPFVTPANGLTYLNTFDIFGRGRYVHNTVNGAFFSWAAGGQIGFTRDLTFRGNYTRSFRAPGLLELFQPVSNSFVFVNDLCSPGSINAGPAPATRATNCAAFLAKFPNATPLDAAAASVPAQSGGNPTLKNEISDSWTFGALLQPRWVRGLSFTADWVHIAIANPIANLSVATIASACFDNPVFNAADPANGNAFCSQIKRYATGQGGAAANGGDRGGQVVTDTLNPGVRSGYVNGKRILFSGIQATVNYVTSLDSIHVPGRFEFNTDFLFVRRRLIDITGVAPLRTDGTFNTLGGITSSDNIDPKFQFQSNIAYVGDAFGASTSVNFIGKQIAARTALSTDIREFNTLNSYATVNASVFFNVESKFRLTLVVTNLFDRVGQQYYGAYPLALTNDLLGRRYTASVKVLF